MNAYFTSHLGLLIFLLQRFVDHGVLPSFPTRRSSDLDNHHPAGNGSRRQRPSGAGRPAGIRLDLYNRSEEHTSELQSRGHLVCRLLLEKKNKKEGKGMTILWDTRYRFQRLLTIMG